MQKPHNSKYSEKKSDKYLNLINIGLHVKQIKKHQNGTRRE